jgi:phosphatidylinositol-4,5-bisphosphate 3-kinase
LDNFMLSCAGYTVAMFVLGIGDRHNDNIMLLPCGKLFHIDFGHVMGNFKRKYFGPIGVLRERSPMLLPGVFVHVINSGGPGQFERFRVLCDRAYLALRSSGCLLISLLALMLSTGMPELQAEGDLEYMRTQLQLDQSVTEDQALAFFHAEFNTSLRQGFTVTMNWWTHAVNQM